MAKSNNVSSAKAMINPVTIIIAVAVVAILAVVSFLVLNQNKPATTTPTAIDEVANAPVGCPKSTSIVVKSNEAGTQNITTSNSNFLQWRKDQGMLIFTNYTLNPDSVYSDITSGRVLTVIKFSVEDGSALVKGTYRKTAQTGTAKPNLYTPEYNISTVGLAGGVFDNNANVVVDYLGTDYVCGTVTSTDSSSSINGSFIAKYVDKINN